MQHKILSSYTQQSRLIVYVFYGLYYYYVIQVTPSSMIVAQPGVHVEVGYSFCETTKQYLIIIGWKNRTLTCS